MSGQYLIQKSVRRHRSTYTGLKFRSTKFLCGIDNRALYDIDEWAPVFGKILVPCPIDRLQK
jgi:hypothetical protein